MKFHAVLLYVNDQFPDILTFKKLQEIGRTLYPTLIWHIGRKREVTL